MTDQRSDKPQLPDEVIQRYLQQLEYATEHPRGFEVFADFRDDTGSHPAWFGDYECAFAAKWLARIRPSSILDIGSYRIFVMGLCSAFNITSLDIRHRKGMTDNETVITSDAKDLNVPDSSFDAITSLCALEHFGLGRYGDEFDLDADRKAMAEIKRALKPNGHLIFTTTVTSAPPSLAFNAHRIYNLEMIHQLCDGLISIEESAYSHEVNTLCSLESITTQPHDWDVYMGCWQKRW